ncbi:MAG: hypothetical protein NHF98_01455 [Candidatus Bostrichicola ureolyticus]|nr:MAG: hypothetical protein NHF98_01455 [Candidatus Bostrichicola ureolyticus]
MNKYIKLYISLIILIIAIYSFFLIKKTIISILLILLSSIFIFLFFQNEFLLLAFFKLKQKDIENAKKWLRFIKNPDLQLTKNQKAYFYFLNGLIYSNINFDKSEYFMQKALSIGLYFKHNIAIAKLNIAIASIIKGNKNYASNLLLDVKKNDKHGLLNKEIEIVKKMIKQYKYTKYYNR